MRNLFKSMKLIIIIALLFSSVASALEYQLNGFGTLGYAVSSTDKARYKSSISGENNKGYLYDSLLGLQLDATLNDDFTFTTQLLAARARGSDDQSYEVRPEWLFLGYRINSDARLRVGRLRLPAYMLSERLEVGYAYPWVRPPAEVYGQIPVNNVDGLDFAFRVPLGQHELMFQPFYGNTMFYFGQGLDATDYNKHYSFDVNDIKGLNVLFTSHEGTKLRASHFVGDLKGNGFPNNSFAHPLFPGVSFNSLDFLYGSGTGLYPNDLSKIVNFEGKFTTFGIEHSLGNTTLLAEYAKRDIRTAVFESAQGGYVSLAHRMGLWTPFVIYAQSHGTSDADNLGQKLRFGQTTWTAGFSYELSATSKLKFQVENTRIGEDRASPYSYERIPANANDLKGLDVTMFSFAYDLVF